MRRLVHVIHAYPPGSKPTRYRDAYLPDEAPPSEPGKPTHRATFEGTHVEKGHTLYFSAKGMRSKPYTKTVPDCVRVHGCRYFIERGIVDGVRYGEPTAMAEVAAVDAQITMEEAHHKAEMDRLDAAKQAALEDAYIRGRKLRVEDIKPTEKKETA